MPDETAIAVLSGKIAQTKLDIIAAEELRVWTGNNSGDERPQRNLIAKLQTLLAEQQAELAELPP